MLNMLSLEKFELEKIVMSNNSYLTETEAIINHIRYILKGTRDIYIHLKGLEDTTIPYKDLDLLNGQLISASIQCNLFIYLGNSYKTKFMDILYLYISVKQLNSWAYKLTV